MNKLVVSFAFSTCVFMSAPALASPDDDILDEITIRVIENENMSIHVTNIALPNIAGEHGVAQADAADNANEHAGLGAENAAEAAENASENAAENAAEAAGNASENAAEAAGNAAENAAEAAENASENAAEAAGNASENAAEAAGNGLDNPGINNLNN